MTAAAHVPIRRVLEQVADLPEIEPLRISPLLLPMWSVEIRATVLDAPPYEVFDQYLTRAIAGAGLHEPARLAGFFGVDEPLVTRALRYLETVGHLIWNGTRVEPTTLGRCSLADGCRYVIKEDRQRLYFDGFTCGPMPRTYYASTRWCGEPELRLSDRTEFRRSQRCRRSASRPFGTRPPSFLQIWCDEEPARRRAVLTRAGSMIVRGLVRNGDDAEQRLTELACRLQIATPDLAELRKHAEIQEDQALQEAVDRITT